MFSQYWVAMPSQEAVQDEKMEHSCFPFAISQFINEVKSAEELGRFLQDVTKRQNLQKEVAELINRFEQKLKTLWGDSAEFRKIQEELKMLQIKFTYDGINNETNKTYLASYREGLPLLFTILDIIEKEPKIFSDDLLKTILLSLFDSMDLCFIGIHTRALYTWMQLSQPTPEWRLLIIRQEMAKKEALLKIRKHPIMQEEGMIGNEVHFVNSILNYFSESFGLLKIEDPLAIDLTHSNSFPPNHEGYRWFLALKEIVTGISPSLTPRAVFEQLAENITGEIRTFKKDEEQFDKILILLIQYGSDNDFVEAYNVMTEAGGLQSEWTLLQNIRLTLLKRCASKKYVDFSQNQLQLTPTVTLHQFPDQSFNYITEILPLGAAPRVIPFSNYFLQKISGYSVSLEQVENSAELQKNIRLITPPALVQLRDSGVVQMYGMVKGKATLTELKLDKNLRLELDWSQESTTLSDKLYLVIAEQKAHDEPSPTLLLKETTKLLFPNTVLSLFDFKALSELSEKGWENIIQFVLDNPDISLPNKEKLFFGNTEFKTSSHSFFHAAVFHGQVNAVDKLLNFAQASLTNEHRTSYLLPTVTGDTPLCIAAQNGHDAVVAKLLDAKNFNNAGDRLTYLRQKCSIRRETALYIAARKGHSAVVKKILESLNPQDRFNYVNEKTIIGLTALHAAAYYGHVAIIEKLLEGLNQQDRLAYLRSASSDGGTPLFLAAQEGRTAVVQKLLEGLNPQDRLDYLRQAEPSHGATPLHMAVQNGHFSVIEKLLETLNPKDRLDYLKQANKYGVTPLFLAALKGHAAILEKLLEGLNPQDRLDYIKQYALDIGSPLFVAAQSGSLSSVKILSSCALNLDLLIAPFTSTSSNFIKFARKHNVLPAMENYLANNPPDQNDKVSMTAIDIAKIMGHLEIANYLLHQIHLAKAGYVYEYARNLDKHIEFAAMTGWSYLVQALDSHKKAIIDPEKKIEQTIEEQTKELNRFKQSIRASSSFYYGPSDHEKMQFLLTLETTMNEFQHKRSEKLTLPVVPTEEINAALSIGKEKFSESAVDAKDEHKITVAENDDKTSQPSPLPCLSGFVNVGETLIITEETEQSLVQHLNTQLINQMKKNGINQIYLFTNMDLEVDIKNAGKSGLITHYELIKKLEAEGIAVRGVITPVDNVHGKGPGGAFKDLYVPAYEKMLKGQPYDQEALLFQQSMAKLPIDKEYTEKNPAAGQKHSMYKYFLENKPFDIASIIYFEDDKTCIDAVSDLVDPSKIYFTTCQTRLHPIHSKNEENHYANSIAAHLVNSKRIFLDELKKFADKCNTKEQVLDLFNEIKKKDGKYAYIHSEQNPKWDKFRLFFKISYNDEKKFWHTATYQDSVKILKNAYLALEDKGVSVAEKRALEEKTFIEYYRGNAPIHFLAAATSRQRSVK